MAVSSANRSRLYPALSLLLTIFAVAPLTYPGFFQSHTGYRAVYNLIDLHGYRGSFITWSPTWGREFDLFRMDGPLGYWLAELFHRLGLSFLDAIKLAYALAFLSSGYAMFIVARRLLQSDGAALLAATVYVYFPYHLATVYVRGAFGQALVWGFFPFLLWALLALQEEHKHKYRLFFLALVLTAWLVLLQPGLALLFALLSAIWLAWWGTPKRARYVERILAPLLFGLALGLLIRVPALVSQMQWIASDGFIPAFVYPFQFLTATWGYAQPRDVFTPDRATPEPAYQIGIAALGLPILALAHLFRNRAADNPARGITLFCTLASGVLLLLMTPWLAPLWNGLGLSLLVQYPSELLALVGWLLALAAGSLVVADPRAAEIPLLAALVIVPILAVYPYLAPEFIPFSPLKPALARFNQDELALLDAKILRPPGVWRHGATVQLELTWQALKQPNHDYTIFLHILDENGQRWGEQDEKPPHGTLQWPAGRVISSTHAVQIDLAGPPEGYHLELGLYQATTGERAVTETGSNVIRIEENK